MNQKIRSKLIKPSTKSFYREGKRLSNYSFPDWLYGYVYSRWAYFYIGVATGEHRLSRIVSRLWNTLSPLLFSHSNEGKNSQKANFANTYHGKVVPLEEASRLVTLNRSINLGDLEQVIPYTRAREIVLRNPDHIVVLDCPCRASRPNPCLPLDVCLIIGEPFASFIVEHHPKRARWIRSQEAVDILKAEDERGHVHHAFFKDAMLGRFYAICNCCACCCGAMQANRNGIPMLASSGYLIQIDHEKCQGCGECIEFCQFKALNLENGNLVVDKEKCMGCGACITKCKHHAHSLVRAPEKGIPLEIQKLMEQAERKEDI